MEENAQGVGTGVSRVKSQKAEACVGRVTQLSSYSTPPQHLHLWFQSQCRLPRNLPDLAQGRGCGRRAKATLSTRPLSCPTSPLFTLPSGPTDNIPGAGAGLVAEALPKLWQLGSSPIAEYLSSRDADSSAWKQQPSQKPQQGGTDLGREARCVGPHCWVTACPEAWDLISFKGLSTPTSSQPGSL